MTLLLLQDIGGTALPQKKSKMAIDEPLTVVQMAINGLKVRKW
jgi:hypothetical protein